MRIVRRAIRSPPYEALALPRKSRLTEYTEYSHADSSTLQCVASYRCRAGRVASGRTARNLKHEKRPQVPRHAVCVLFRTPAHRECPSTPYYTPYLTYNIRVPSWIRCLVDSRHGQQHRSCQSGLDLSPRGRIHAPCLRAGQNGKGGGLLRKESRKSLFVWHSLLRCHWPAVAQGSCGRARFVWRWWWW